MATSSVLSLLGRINEGGGEAGSARARRQACSRVQSFLYNHILTINVPAVYLVRDVMILMLAPPLFSNGLSNGLARIKVIKSKRHIKKQVRWQFYVPERLYSVFLYILFCILNIHEFCSWKWGLELVRKVT